MQAVPAIDILNKSCVRLALGKYDAVTVYDTDPAKVAERFFIAGVRRLHVVDLDAAKSGLPTNKEPIKAILKLAQNFDAKVDVGGGLRTEQDVETMLNAGAQFAVLGTAAIKDNVFREKMIKIFPNQIIVGIDCKDNYVAVNGWTTTETVRDLDFVNLLNECPPAMIIYTDISKDGMLTGVNVEQTAVIAKHCQCPVIASGGIASINDLEQLSVFDNIDGAIVGKAIYNGNIELSELIRRFP